MKVSEVLNETIAAVDEHIAEYGDVSSVELAAILGIIEDSLPHLRALEARVEAINAEELRKRGPNIIPLAEYQRTRGIGPFTSGGAA